MAGVVVAVSSSPTHSFSKVVRESILLEAGLGVVGDAHAGATVKHRSRVARNPGAPNLRQVHLVHEELLEQLRAIGFRVGPGVVGENVTTRGIDLPSLPAGARLRMGQAVVRVTGLRNPCKQLDRYQPGLMAAVLDRDEQGKLVRKAGVMTVVVVGGVLRTGDPIEVELPDGPLRELDVV